MKKLRHDPDAPEGRRMLIAAQILSLAALAFGLQFLWNTTGGTLFLFATIAPLLLTAGAVMMILVIVAKLRKRHSLFDFETFAPGEVVFRQGDAGDCAYFVREGSVEVVQDADGKEHVIAKLAPGELFGEMALLDSRPRNATVRAVSQCTVAVVGKRNFMTMLNLMPRTQEDIMKTVKERVMSRPVQE
jgi:Cyclic nucleotide-binding domain